MFYSIIILDGVHYYIIIIYLLYTLTVTPRFFFAYIEYNIPDTVLYVCRVVGTVYISKYRYVIKRPV